MWKKSLFILLLVICVSFFVPDEVIARENHIYNNIEVDYRFLPTDKDNKSEFKLYDITGSLYFESQYDEESGNYYFYNDEKKYYECRAGFCGQSYNDYETSFRDYIKYSDELITISDKDYFLNFINTNHLHGSYIYDNRHCCGNHYDKYNYYDYIPMILLDVSTGNKKIVFASLTMHIVYKKTQSNQELGYPEYYVGVYLFNNQNYNDKLNLLKKVYNNSLNSNVLFMKNAVYDYSDDLWEELNNEAFASSEMQYDNSDTDLSSPNLITFKTNNDKAIYSKYKSNVNYRFKVKNGNGMNFKLHDISNTFNFSSLYDKNSDTYSIVDNSNDNDYSEGIKEFSEIIINEVKNDNFSELASKYNSITSDNCSSDSCNIYTYIPMILEGKNNSSYVKQIVLGLVEMNYHQESGNDYYDVSLNVYNNTCDLLNSNIDLDMNKLINLSRSIEEDYSNDLMDKYSNGSVPLEDIIKSEDINSLKDKYCNDVPVISLRKISNPKTWNSGVLILIISMIMVIGSGMFIIKKKV